MALPPQITTREYQKFIDAGIDKTAVRVANDGAPLATTSSLELPTIINVAIASANVEQSHTFPVDTKRFLVKSRGVGKIKLAHVATESATNYITIWPGAVYDSQEVKANPYTIYFQSPIAGLVVEMESWA